MRRLVLLCSLICYSLFLAAQMMEPVKWTHAVADEGTTIKITLTAKIDAGWHLYDSHLPNGGPNPTALTLIADNEPLECLMLTADREPKLAYDDMFEMVLPYYEKAVVFTCSVTKEELNGKQLVAEVDWIACDDKNCVPGHTTFNIAAGKETSTDAGKAAGRSLWWLLLMGMLGGVLAIFTPCVWPIIPMTVSFFMKRSGSKAVREALMYGVAIVLIYVALGLLVTIVFGASALNDISTNAIVNIFFFALLVVFALSFFGAFELTLPSSWSTQLDSRARQTSGWVSILLMAFTLVIVSFSCTGPIIGTLLVEAAGKSLLAPAVGMSGFAIALALPFSLFAMFPQWMHKLPRSGGWMDSFKVVLAFLELALSLKFFSVADLAYGWHLLDREVFVSLWIVIFALLGLYLLGVFRFRHEEKHDGISVLRFMLAVISLAFAMYMVPGLWGAPLKSISAFAPPMSTQDWTLADQNETNNIVQQIEGYDEVLRQAKREGKHVLLDFSGYGCVNCRKMEAKVLTDKRVEQALQNFIVVTLMVDDKTLLEEPVVVTENGKERRLRTVGDRWSFLQRSKYGANAQPYYVKLNSDGVQYDTAYSYDEDIEKFIEWLNE